MSYKDDDKTDYSVSLGFVEAAPISRYWYFQTYWECPVCGSYSIERSRRYTPKPDDRKYRVANRSLYCGCMDLSFFLMGQPTL